MYSMKRVFPQPVGPLRRDRQLILPSCLKDIYFWTYRFVVGLFFNRIFFRFQGTCLSHSESMRVMCPL